MACSESIGARLLAVIKAGAHGRDQDLSAGWWDAFCRYEADGKMHGGHAGPPPVRVYEEDGKLDPAIVERIWTLAGEVQSQGNSSNSIVITLADGTTRVASWGWKEQPSDPKLRELAELLMEHHVGGW